MLILRRKGGITAKALAKLIGCNCSKRFIPDDFIINYGQCNPYANLNAEVNYNKVEVQKILEENEVRVPRIYRKSDNIPSDAFPLLARKYYHSKGRDIIFVKNQSALNELSSNKYDYLTKYIEKRKEYRVHILGTYKVIVNVKFTKEEADELVRSHDKGWKQIEYNGEFKNKLIEIAKKCIKILKYDFGAVDIILGGNGRFYVLEVNSAPGLEERKLKIYADYFLHEESKVMKKEIKTEKPKENVKEEVYDQGEYAYYGNRTN